MLLKSKDNKVILCNQIEFENLTSEEKDQTELMGVINISSRVFVKKNTVSSTTEDNAMVGMREFETLASAISDNKKVKREAKKNIARIKRIQEKYKE